MRDGLSAPEATYSAFISYSHGDAGFARHLQRKLQTYKFPRRLQGRVGSATNDRRLKPVFRDRTGLAAAGDLADAIEGAIKISGALIVICSPRARASAHVGQEVQMYQALHPGGLVLTALIEGEPGEAFPATLLTVGADGQIAEPLAADFRKTGDGSSLAQLKLLAALTGLRLDELVQWDAQQRIRRTMVVSAAGAGILLAIGSLSVVAVQARLQARRDSLSAQKMIAYEATDLRDRLKAAGRLDLVDTADQGALAYYQGRNLAGLSADELVQFARALRNHGQDQEGEGNYDAATSEFMEARHITAALLAAAPDDQNRVFEHAQSVYYVGDVYWRVADYVNSEQSFEAYAALADKLVALAPSNPKWLIEAGDASSNLGSWTLTVKNDLTRARSYFAASLAAFGEADRLQPNDWDTNVNIADDDSWLANIERLQGNMERALALKTAQKNILVSLLNRKPNDPYVRTQLTGNYLGVGRIYAEQGRFVLAVQAFRSGQDMAEGLAHDDPKNLDAQRQARIFSLFLARTWMTMPPSSRPSSDTIDKALGDCNSDGKLPQNLELTDFCIVLHARHLAQSGGHAEAAALLNSLPDSNVHAAKRLTPRWSLNFLNEIKEAKDDNR